MAYDAFLKLDGLDGESTTKGHEKWIEVSSFQWGVDHPVSITASGRSTGKANVHDFKITKPVDASSPKLFLSCVTGKNFDKGSIWVRKAGGDNALPYMKYDFKGILITGFENAASGGDDNPMEEMTLNFTGLDYTYTMQKPDGTAGGAIQVTYDLKTGAGK
jgi:type VI secretion system secreted protein Hcp